MIKQIFIHLTLILFTTCVAAEDFIMKCGDNTYKYVQDPTGDQVFLKHRNYTKNKYEEWCSEGFAPSSSITGLISKEGWVRIIKDKKATCIVKKLSFRDNTERTNSVAVYDFVNLTRHAEWYHTNTGSKKNVKDFKCKKKNK
jgi:hypothetical protein